MPDERTRLVSRTGHRFDTNGNLTDEQTRTFIRRPLEGFVEWSRQFQPSGASSHVVVPD